MIELPLVPFSREKPGEEMKRGWVWGVGWLGVFVVEAGKEKSQMPVARPGWAPGGRGTRGTASGSSPAHPSGFIPSQWVHPIPWGPSHPMGSVPRHRVRPMPWKLPERSRPRGWARGRRIGHFTHQLPKMVAPTLPSPSARMHPRGGEGQGQPPAREGARNGSQDGIRGRN